MKDITTIILAGGESKRMGQDKAFLLWEGKTFIRHILESVDTFSSQIIISGNKPPNIYLKEAENLKNIPLVIKDITPFSGPLNGIVSCSSFIEREIVFLSTCDTPYLNIQALEYLYNSLEGYETVIPVIGEKFQPLNTFYTKEAVKKAYRMYSQGVRSLFQWIKSLKVKYIPDKDLKKFDPNLRTFTSINTPRDYENFIKENQL